MDGNTYAQLLIRQNISYFILKLQYLFWPVSRRNISFFKTGLHLKSLSDGQKTKWFATIGCFLVFCLLSKNLFTMKIKLLLMTLSYKPQEKQKVRQGERTSVHKMHSPIRLLPEITKCLWNPQHTAKLSNIPAFVLRRICRVWGTTAWRWSSLGKHSCSEK